MTLKYYAMVVGKRDKESADVMDTIARRADVHTHVGGMEIRDYGLRPDGEGVIMTLSLRRPDSAPS